MQNTSTIAKTVIDILGGAPIVSEIVNRDVSQVYRWTYPKEKGGTGGLVPAVYQQLLLDWAKQNEKPLLPEHFFESEHRAEIEGVS